MIKNEIRYFDIEQADSKKYQKEVKSLLRNEFDNLKVKLFRVYHIPL